MILDELLNDFRNNPRKKQLEIAAYGYYVCTGSIHFRPKDISAFLIDHQVDHSRNISRDLLVLSKQKPRTILKQKDGYSLERGFIKAMDAQYCNKFSREISSQMRAFLEKISDKNQRCFLEDAIKCFEARIYRPSILLAWLVILDILYDYVLKNYLSEFNAALSNQRKKLCIKKKTDFEDLKESLFIELLRSSGIITKEQKKILDDKLAIRNSAAHPNQTSFKEAKVISFIEELFTDIVDKLN